MIYDHVIVGAGTAGCTLAARLSEDLDRSVLVLEAGPDYPVPGAVPAPLRDAYAMPRDWDWGLEATVTAQRVIPFAAGKVVGGTSSVNGAGAWRPPASDFAAWAALGLPEWAWENVLGDFNAVESDADFGERPWHGDSGPVPIVRWRDDELLAPMRGWLEALRAGGHPYCEDMNAPDAVGVGVNPQSRRGRDRVSAAGAYLQGARGRPRLELRPEVSVERVEVRDARVVGVRAAGELVPAREVIVCAGVPLSPALLMRSGIGPADELRDAGIAPLVDRPGVGTRVIDQPAVVALAVPRAATENGSGAAPCRSRNGEASDAPAEPFLQLAARLRAFPGCAADDAWYMCLFTGMPVAPPLTSLLRAERAHWLIVGDLAPASTGTVRLTGADPAAPPVIDLGFYGAPGDLARMRAGFRAMWELAQHPAFTATIDRFALVSDRIVADDARLDGLITSRTMSRQPWGGCPMGPAAEPSAVVDAECRVHGVDGLRVVDASVVPVPLRAGGALTTMMIAERVARGIRESGR